MKALLFAAEFIGKMTRLFFEAFVLVTAVFFAFYFWLAFADAYLH